MKIISRSLLEANFVVLPLNVTQQKQLRQRMSCLFCVSRSQSSSVSHFKNSATAEMHSRMEVYANRYVRPIMFLMLPTVLW